MLDRDVSYFLEIAETRCLGRAAEALSVSQSALSRAIQRLEAQYGVQLLERMPRGVELTAAGMVMADHAREMARISQCADHAMQGLRRSRLGGLRLGLGASFQQLAFKALVPRLLRERPGINLDLETGHNRDLLDRLQAGRFDAVLIMQAAPLLEERTTVLLGKDRLVPVVREGHPLLAKPSPTVADLVAYPWVGYGRASTLDQYYDQLLQELGHPAPHRVLTSNAREMVIQAIRTSDCIGVVTSTHLGLPDSPCFGLRAVPVSRLELERHVAIIRREEGAPSFVLLRAIELIQQEFETLGWPAQADSLANSQSDSLAA